MLQIGGCKGGLLIREPLPEFWNPVVQQDQLPGRLSLLGLQFVQLGPDGRYIREHPFCDSSNQAPPLLFNVL
jgi:hypothetical protein